MIYNKQGKVIDGVCFAQPVKADRMSDRPTDFDELLQRAFRYALSLTHDYHLAEDVLQDVCVTISRRGGPWQIEYMITAIRNRYIDVYRRHQTISFDSLDESDAWHMASTTDPCTAALEGADDELGAALSTLRLEERELLYLSAVEGYSAAQIAHLTEKPRGTVLSMLHRAKQKLREFLVDGSKSRRSA